MALQPSRTRHPVRSGPRRSWAARLRTSRATCLAVGFSALLLVAVVLPAAGPRLAAPAAADTPLAPTAAHPNSAPLWLPLRTSARVSCAKSSCGASRSHGYWAIDFLGKKGDPVYAAGAGIAHVGGNSGGCGEGDVDSGRWIWIDHGGGTITKYHHLNAITITNGARVGPATRIGTMGSTGDLAPCTTDYLHFEVRTDGLTGTRVNPGTLNICTSAGRKALPAGLGYSSWDDKGMPNTVIPTSTSACIGTPWAATPAQPRHTLKASSTKVTVSWPKAPAGTTQVMVRFERYSTALKAYGRAYHYTYAGSATSATYTGLTNGRAHRASVAFRNASGTSAWSPVSTITPAAVPTAPKSPRYLTWPHKKYIHYGWYRSDARGAAITNYEIALRCQTKGKYGAWSYKSKGIKDTFHNYQGVKQSVCQVKVKSWNRVGWSAWSKTSTVKK